MRQDRSKLLFAIRVTTIGLITLCMVSAAAAAPPEKNKRSPTTSRKVKTGIHQTSRSRRLQHSRDVTWERRSNRVAVTRRVRGDNDRFRRYSRRPEYSYSYRYTRNPGFLSVRYTRAYRNHHRFHRYIPLTFRGRRYFYNDGAYYRFTGLGFSLVDDDIGVYLYSLPFGYNTLFIGGYPYYYVNHHYYIHDHMRNVYVQVDNPDQTASDDDTGGDSSAYRELIVYPKQGQSAEQEKRDKYECYLWAVKETGFDPSQGKPGNLQDYQRAKSACLEGRGYVVN